MTEQELKALYDAIVNRKVQLANDIINCMYFTRSQVLGYLNQYIKSLPQEEQQKFKKNYDWFLASYYHYFQVVSSLLEEYEKTGTLHLNNYVSISDARICLSKFKEKFPEYSDKIQEICKIMDNYKKQSAFSVKKNTIDTFFDRNQHETHYENDLYDVATSENPVSAFSKLRWTQTTFNRNLNLFKNRYKDEDSQILATKFEEWFSLYLKKQKEKELTLAFEYRTDKLNIAQSVVEDLIASGKSIYEYCHEHLEYQYSDIKKYILTVFGESSGHTEKSKSFIQKIEERENQYFIDELNYIAEEIINNENFDIIDYYLATKLNIDDFMKKVPSAIQINDFAQKNFERTYRRFQMNTSNPRITSLNKQQELKVNRIIKGYLVTPEDKEAIFKYLEEEQIPLNTFTYRAALNRLVSGNLDFIQKINVYKGSI